MYISTFSFTLAWLNPRPGSLTLGKKAGTLCIRGWEAQARSGRVQKILLPPKFEPRTVQPIASYSDYTIPALRNTNTVPLELLEPNRQRQKSLE